MKILPPCLVAKIRNAYWKLAPRFLTKRVFANSPGYWEKRYEKGGNSGPGSYGKFARFKADILNDFVESRRIITVVEFGCGDGSQLALARYPSYLGVDVSAKAVALCREKFANDRTKTFIQLQEYRGQKAQLSLSLDVIYHLVEDAAFEAYMQKLFDDAENYVAIYSSDTDDNRDIQGPHIRHRKWTEWVAVNRSEWKLSSVIPNPYPYRGDGTEGSFADFYLYEKLGKPESNTGH
jgi:SAM-dependent methyltransferase